MRLRAVALAGVALCSGAVAQETPPASPPASSPASPIDVDRSAAGTSGVLVYQPEFFASLRPNTALDMIQRVPGFGVDNGNVDARGLSGAAGNVLIDGKRPSSKSDSLAEILRRIPAASVERIELIRGGAPGIDMQGRSVVANVIVRQAVVTEIVAEANAYVYDDGFVGPFGKLQYSRRAGDEQTEGQIFATRDRTGNTARGTRRRFDATGAGLEEAGLALDDRIRQVNARGSIQRRVGGGLLRVNALGDYVSQDIVQRIDVLSGTDVRTASRSRAPGGELGATWTRPLGPRTELELTGLQRLNRNDFRADSATGADATRFTIRSTGGESNARAILKYRQSERWAFEGGGEIAYNFLDSDTGFVANGVGVALPNAAVLVSEVRGEGFAQGTWHPSARLTVAGTLRVEASRIAQSGEIDLARSFLYPKPRLQVTWLPAPGTQLRFRVENEVGQLDFADFTASTEVALGTVAGGNAELRPQRQTVFEGVYERRFWGKGVLELLAQHRAVRDIVDIIPLIGGFDAVGNIGDGRVEFGQVRLTLPFDRLGVKNALLTTRASITDSHVTDPLTGQDRAFRNTVRFSCGISFSHDLFGGKFTYGGSHGCDVDRFTNYRTGEARFYRGEPFVSAYAIWKPRRNLTLQVDAGNITDAGSDVVRDLYTGPRNTAPLAFREERRLKQGRYVYLQVRRTF